MNLLKSKKALSPVVAAIKLIAVTVAVSFAVAAWMGTLTFTFMKTESYPDIYDARNSTVTQAYENCLKELKRLNYTVYDAKFSKEIWIKTQNFTTFLNEAYQHGINIVFVDLPKERGWLGLGGFKAYIWFIDKLPNEQTTTIYYELKN